ncbi:MAG: bifunctional phosphoribosyl-AMP cyclohydrolase/phosphoribosyl-ATP diphosphatase HisIE [Schleiferiaceae bacterium]|nr:bifunctional phosphoribosyl-AMP cyclohydrolase/phosphoribosyl-ATP diphosphatase HisIE [Schleiferiaceae bacterium]
MVLNFNKNIDGLLPVIVQDIDSKSVLMLGYMNAAAWQQTLNNRHITFYSRTKKRLWTKGETSGNFLEMIAFDCDCDADTLLIFARPKGPTCHKGRYSCFPTVIPQNGQWQRLQTLIKQRSDMAVIAESYTKSLLDGPLGRCAQKVGEEAVEVVIAAMKGNRQELIEESADLLYHLSVLWKKSGVTLEEVERILWERNQKK